ncbi:prepilin-type N-terminal cleavage/methylation domain-containing protein [Patescibacteria group bacterium]|nr:prepilin-type N-terminal cleavage/methylation domain-containing protein [Patescibacteria group bacterium]
MRKKLLRNGINKESTIFKKNFGFTLIELIISLTVIATLSIIGIAAFVNQSKVSALQSGAAEFYSVLNVAKSRAMSQVKPDNLCIGRTLEGYSVVIDSTTTFKLYVNCGGNEFLIKSGKLPTNITFASSPDTTSTNFFFGVLTNSVQGAGVVTVKGYGNSKVLNIDGAGNIKLN